MSKGTEIKLEYYTYTDPITNTEICRLTPPEVICHRNYFYQKCFTNDGNKLLFAGAFDQNWNYYLLDLPTGRAVQLTEGKGDNTFGGFLSPDDKYLFYVKSEKYFIELNLETLEEQTIYTVPTEWVGYGTWVANSDCNQLVGIEIAAEDWLPLNDWQAFQDFFHTNPLCRLIKIDITTGARETIIQENRWLGHPIYRPFDDNTIAFCHEGPHDLVDARMWLINEDGSNLRKVKEHEKGESCTHEFWVPNGSLLTYVSFMKGESHRTIFQYDPENNQNTKLMNMPTCSHLMSNFDGSLLVGDGSGTPIDVSDNKNHETANDPFIYLFDTKNKTTQKIATHGTSWKVIQNDRQVSHPHPSFSPDSKKILFGSDKDGLPAIYLVTLP